MKIGFFDSGIGGLSVLNRAMHMMPGEEFMYYADIDNVPYGTKAREQIIGYAQTAVSFLIGRGAGAVVIACNTATSAAITLLRDKYDIPIIGMEPAVKPAIAKKNGKRVLVIATPLTLRETKLQSLISRLDSEKIVDLLPLPRLVTFAENGEFNTPAVSEYLQEAFRDLNTPDYSVLVLGCTHFNYFKDSYSRFFSKGTEFIDGIEGTVRHLKDMIFEKNKSTTEGGGISYFFSGRQVTDKNTLDKIAALHDRLEKMHMIKRV